MTPNAPRPIRRQDTREAATKPAPAGNRGHVKEVRLLKKLNSGNDVFRETDETLMAILMPWK